MTTDETAVLGVRTETTVVVDRWGQSYHDPRKLASTHDMEEMTEVQAREEGAVACSRCWDEKDEENPSYDFPYLRSDSA
jgi:hypothetical protein